jgi:methylglutaconyl-CoA hydratase
VPAARLDDTVDAHLRDLLAGAPGALAATKALVREVAGRPVHEVADLTSRAIAAQRVSAEGQEGLGAFLEKRRAGWIP